MPVFRYTARDQNGKAVDGTMEATGADVAAANLSENGLIPIDVYPCEELTPLATDLNQFFLPAIKNTDLIQFTRQMHSMLRAGVPMFRSVSGLAETTGNANLANTLHNVMSTLESGHPLSDALAQHPKVFSEFYVSLVRVGETTGKLQQIFDQLAFYLDRDYETRAKIKSALRYPSIVLAAIAAALAIVSIWVIPAFSSMFASFGSDLPFQTRILVAISDFMYAHWFLLLTAVGTFAYGLYRYVRTDTGRYRWDRIKLRLPLVGGVVYKASLARFSYLFSMAINSGVPLITALAVVGNALNNRYLEDRLLEMREGIAHGRPLSLAATHSGIFDPLVLQMLTVGEETGTTGELLEEVADYYDREVRYATENLSAAIEPILTVVIGGMLLLLAMGIFLPMWDLASVALR